MSHSHPNVTSMDGDNHRDNPLDITGKRFSHYYVRHRIGSGGMGVVYEAEDVRLNRKVALKVLPPWSRFDDRAKARFSREAKAASALNHPNVCTIYEYDDIEGRPLIAMEFVEGSTLAERLREGSLSRAEVMRIVGSVAAGLEHAHNRNVVHRDVKPGNVLLGLDGVVKLVDFGLAKLADSTSLTQPGSTFGTVAYMSPEQANGDETSAASDVWSLGVLWYEALMNERPFPGDNASTVLYRILNTPPVGLDQLASRHGHEVHEIIERCLQKDATSRPTIGEISDFARRLSKHETVAKVDKPRRNRVWLLVGSVTVAIAGLAIVLGSLLDASPSLESSTLVVLPTVVDDPDLQLTLSGVMESISHELSGQAVDREVVGRIAHFTQFDVDQSIQTADAAAGVLGIPFALISSFLVDGSVGEMQIGLIETHKLDTLGLESIAVDLQQENQIRNIRQLRIETRRAMARLLGISGFADSRDQADLASPGAAEFFARGLGILGQRDNPTSVETAIVLLERAIDESPGYAQAHAELGRAYLYRYDDIKDEKWLDAASRSCSRALDLDQTLTRVYVTLGQINLKKGQYGLAIADFNRALENDPNDTEALLGIADVYDEQGLPREAESAFQRAIATSRDYWPSYRKLGLFYYFHSRLSEAAVQFEIVKDLAPFNNLGYRGLGAIYFAQEEFELAIENWERALELAPNDDASLSNLASAYFYTGDYATAAETYERALDADDSDYLVWGNLGSALYYMPGHDDRFREIKHVAVDMAKRALELNPNDRFVEAKLAGYYLQLGDTTQARTRLEAVVAIPRDHLEDQTVFEVATIYESLGDREAALDWLSAAIDRNYPTIEIKYYPGLEDLRQDPRFHEIMRAVPPQDQPPG